MYNLHLNEEVFERTIAFTHFMLLISYAASLLQHTVRFFLIQEALSWILFDTYEVLCGSSLIACEN
jgi:hypothetical protein